MADYNGSYQYLPGNGRAPQEGACRVSLDAETFSIAPENAPPLAIDYGDVAGVMAANFQIRLPLDSGATLVLRQLAKAYDRVARDLLESYRKRAIQCLLLEDMEELGCFPGAFELLSADHTCSVCGALNRGTKFCSECGHAMDAAKPVAAPACPSCGAPASGGKFCPECGKPAGVTTSPAVPKSGEAEIHLYKTNLAVLPCGSQGFQWRLADIDSVRFTSGSLDVILQSGNECLRLFQLARRTDEFAAAVRQAIGAVNARSAQALHATFRFLTSDQLQEVTGLWREGRSAAVARLNAIHPRLGGALAANAVDADLKPYYEELLKRTVPGLLYAGFKLIRPEDRAEADAAQDSADDSEAAMPDADKGGPDTLYWFFFPLATRPGSQELSNIVAWEASSRSGRATYFFRLVEPARAQQLNDPAKAPALVDGALRRLNRVLGMLNFRRRPIYLSDAELETNPQYRRYAIAARRIPELREVRASFIGRAMHVSPEVWQEQVERAVSCEL